MVTIASPAKGGEKKQHLAIFNLSCLQQWVDFNKWKVLRSGNQLGGGSIRQELNFSTREEGNIMRLLDRMKLISMF